ncbi:hypothetical protein D9V32_03330 [Mycetocola tolaasinivorans]|uniref:DUF4267 domain-containing protein n=1 Tax=Mycetocola tolaasinivorans TaxID=76635 RepID=A0A3L7AB02_9MICO|nr:hypothetical protein [Mycetocola tolaasinivorans]RLP77493.1 hypothetical protein D9V32_03330 [Mycetocola tolaasinivorans]
MFWWLALLNTAAALVSSGFGIAAMLRPRALAPTEHKPADRFYAVMYGARSVPLGIAVAIGVWIMPASPALALLLAVAAIAQIVDIITGVRTRLWTMVGGAAFATLCHLSGIGVVLAG